MEPLTIAIIVIASLAALAVVASIVRWVARVGRSAEGLIKQINMAQVRAETVPRSLAGMESVLLPQIMKDFPEYNGAVIADRVKADALMYYVSAKEGRLMYTKGVSKTFRETVRLPEDVAGGIAVHRVSLADYDRRSRDKVITYQAAAKYEDGHGETHQTRLTMKYIAAYDDDFTEDIRVIKCPNCGAPVPAWGDKVCRYCGAALHTQAGLCWVLNEIKES
ncbi:MAG: zinc ribbon domain-containing protein [Clostridia bacterium]|nr:zinc ribbon domain-containing protein [Clostridia bacterium]